MRDIKSQLYLLGSQIDPIRDHILCTDKLKMNPSNPSQQAEPSSDCLSVPFPWKLHEILETASIDGFDHIVSWLPDGKSFRVHDRNDFVSQVLPKYFKQTKYKSFQRQLNLWGFESFQYCPGNCGYRHSFLVRGKPHLCRGMRRVKVKSANNRQKIHDLIDPTVVPSPLMLPKHTEQFKAIDLRVLPSDCMLDKSLSSCDLKYVQVGYSLACIRDYDFLKAFLQGVKLGNGPTPSSDKIAS